ncbi:MAG: M42 family metallopeptidase [Oscillospiraceae bacterium]|nr:M42 family metallopeptidase [Oscillospiraceae bacterium]
MKLLEKLTQTDSPSGSERKVREIIGNEIKKYCDEITVDALGNLIAHKSGNGRKIMFAAHIDEIGVIASFIDENGFIRFGSVGGLEIKALVNRRVMFENGTMGVIGSEEEGFSKKAEISKLYIDIGAKNKKEAEKKVSVGDTAVFVGGFYKSGDIVVSKALDNRAGCYALIEAMKEIKDAKNDLYFVFTVQEEVGLRGAGAASFGIEPDFAVAVDVTDTGDTPDAPNMAVSLGKGAAVKVMDRSVMCDSDVRLHMVETAKTNKIPYQLEIMTDGGTDAGAIHKTKSGIKTGGISIPTRYIHSPSEMASVSDIKVCIKLISALAQSEWK